MAASLLAKGKVTLHRVPRITDVSVMWSLLEALGARLRHEGDGTVTIDASNVASHRAPYTLVRKLNASFESSVRCWDASAAPKCRFPADASWELARPTCTKRHFLALGCDVKNAHGYLIATSKQRRLQGADVEFRMPSVGATKNAMLASVLAEGTTTLRNVAMEPEVVDLADFLIKMGAKIAGAGSDTIVIDGVSELHGVEYSIIPDRIVAGSLLLSGALRRAATLP